MIPSKMERLSPDVYFYMEKAISDLSASTLRKQLIEEIKEFIECLDDGSIQDLEKRKEKLKEIFKHLSEKELIEMAPLIWGRNSSRNNPEKSKE